MRLLGLYPMVGITFSPVVVYLIALGKSLWLNILAAYIQRSANSVGLGTGI
jgi:hypothetical protein